MFIVIDPRLVNSHCCSYASGNAYTVTTTSDLLSTRRSNHSMPRCYFFRQIQARKKSAKEVVCRRGRRIDRRAGARARINRLASGVSGQHEKYRNQAHVSFDSFLEEYHACPPANSLRRAQNCWISYDNRTLSFTAGLLSRLFRPQSSR